MGVIQRRRRRQQPAHTGKVRLIMAGLVGVYAVAAYLRMARQQRAVVQVQGVGQLAERRPQRAPATPTEVRTARVRPTTVLRLVLGGCFVGACTVTAYTYSYADTHPPGRTEFTLFWLGQLVWLAPAVARLFGSSAGRAERLALVAATGLFEFAPKVLRSPYGLLFPDELAHGLQIDLIREAGHPFVANPLLPIVEFFPGLHTVVVALRDLTGLSTFAAGMVLVALLHVVAVAGVWVLAERYYSARVAGVAALLFAFNPAFMFFDSQVSYESLGIVLVIWVLVCVAGIQTSLEADGRAGAWIATGCILAAACVTTHHLSSYVMAIVLCGIAAISIVRWRSGAGTAQEAVAMTALAGVATASAVVWLVFIGSRVVAYLSPHLSQGLGQIFSLIRDEQPNRTLFQASSFPAYEKAAAYLTPVLLGLGVLARLRWRNPRPQRGGVAVIGFALLGLVYFPSLPFMVTSQSEGARRLWAFAYIGLAVWLAPAIAAALDGVARRWRVTKTWAVGLGVIVVLVGNVSVQANAAYRFPGPYLYGSDTRSYTPELVTAAMWFRDAVGPGQRVIAARDEALAFGTVGEDVAVGSTGFPIWELYYSAGLPSPMLVAQLKSSGYAYVVIDQRMAESLPIAGVYFATGEPAFLSPPAEASLDKFDRVAWASKLYGTVHLAIYRLDLDTLAACSAATPPMPSGCAP